MASRRAHLRAAIVGPGFIARQHVDALRRLGIAVVGASGSDSSSTKGKIKALGIERVFANYLELVESPLVDVVHVTTPNHLHCPVVLAAHAAGKHVICEKPLALDSREADIMRESARRAFLQRQTRSVVIFNYRGSALVPQARARLAAGDFGEISFVHGAYLQDWMFDPGVYSWRSDTAKGGVSSALADIGSHWCDLAQHLTGLTITAVCADLMTAVPQRIRAAVAQESFQSSETAGDLVDVTAEDTAAVLLRFENQARGVFCVGQVHAGHKNDLWVEVNGRKLSLRWHQERQNELWIGHAHQANQTLARDPALLDADVQKFARLPAGHQEGWSDSLFNVIRDAYDWISERGTPQKPAAVADFREGAQVQCVVDSILKSHAAGGLWTSVDRSTQAD